MSGPSIFLCTTHGMSTYLTLLWFWIWWRPVACAVSTCTHLGNTYDRCCWHRVEKSEIDVAGGLYVLFGSGEFVHCSLIPATIWFFADTLSWRTRKAPTSVIVSVFTIIFLVQRLQFCLFLQIFTHMVLCRLCVVPRYCSLHPPVFKGETRQVLNSVPLISAFVCYRNNQIYILLLSLLTSLSDTGFSGSTLSTNEG